MAIVTMRELLECGVHFGHQTKRWNPKMKKYIFTARNDIHVIDLQKTLKLIEKTYQIVKEIAAAGGKVLFVGTKKQAQEAIQTEALRCDMYYVNQRWLGGTLTNNATIRKSIIKLKKLEKMKEEHALDNLSKKENSIISKQITQLNHYLGGIKDMVKLPDLMVVLDTKKEHLSIKEANILNIPVIGVVDTNADPTEVKYPIPANDDAIRSIKLICTIMANAVLDGRKGLSATETPAEEPTEESQEEFNIDMLDQIEMLEEVTVEDIDAENMVKTRKKKSSEDVLE